MWGFSGGATDKESACQYVSLSNKRGGFDPWVVKIPWRRVWQPTTVFFPEESHGQRSLAGYSLQGCKELDMTEDACRGKVDGNDFQTKTTHCYRVGHLKKKKKNDTGTPTQIKWINFWVSESAKVGLKISQVIQMCSLSWEFLATYFFKAINNILLDILNSILKFSYSYDN